MRPSELGWLQRRDKQLPTPVVIFSMNDEAYGFYHAPDVGNEWEYDGERFDASRGMIEISTYFNDSPTSIEATLAHEWRHHWQYHNGIVFGGESNLSAIELYRKEPTERDAVLFEHKLAPTIYSQCVLDKLGLYVPTTIYSFK